MHAASRRSVSASRRRCFVSFSSSLRFLIVRISFTCAGEIDGGMSDRIASLAAAAAAAEDDDEEEDEEEGANGMGSVGSCHDAELSDDDSEDVPVVVATAALFCDDTVAMTADWGTGRLAIGMAEGVFDSAADDEAAGSLFKIERMLSEWSRSRSSWFHMLGASRGDDVAGCCWGLEEVPS